MVLGQYRRLTEGARGPRTAVVAKAILFHDIDKMNAKRQFGDSQVRHDAEPEHLLAVELIRRYAPLFGDSNDLKLVLGLVNSDPFGFYLRGLHAPGVALSYLALLTFEAYGRQEPVDGQLSDDDVASIQDTYRTAHQYYQADFSSYTQHSTYVASDGGTRRGQVAFDHHFATTDEGELRPDGGRFPYVGEYAQKMALLDAKMADPASIRSWFEASWQEKQLQTAETNLARGSDWPMTR